MMRYDIKEVTKSVKQLEKLSSEGLADKASPDMMRALLYKINQQAHNILHNINNYGIH
jgi:hypothetical protein